MCGKQLKISNIRVFRQFLCERTLLIFVRCTRVKFCLQFLFLFYASDLIPIDMHDDMLTLLNFCFVPYRVICFYPAFVFLSLFRFAEFETIAAKRFLYKSCVLC